MTPSERESIERDIRVIFARRTNSRDAARQVTDLIEERDRRLAEEMTA